MKAIKIGCNNFIFYGDIYYPIYKKQYKEIINNSRIVEHVFTENDTCVQYGVPLNSCTPEIQRKYANIIINKMMSEDYYEREIESLKNQLILLKQLKKLIIK